MVYQDIVGSQIQYNNGNKPVVMKKTEENADPFSKIDTSKVMNAQKKVENVSANDDLI